MFVVGGESLIDLISKPAAPDGMRELVAKAGGSPMNCAIALSKLGVDAGFLCPISSDTFGDYILKPLNAAGVTQLITQRVREPSTLAVVTDDGKGNPRYAFYREADRAFLRDVLEFRHREVHDVLHWRGRQGAGQERRCQTSI